ncbi:MAG: hypothetical protein ACI81P_003533 [Neolewinella sp.]
MVVIEIGRAVPRGQAANRTVIELTFLKMKTATLLFALLLLMGSNLHAQFTPFSPPAHLEQVVGDTTIIIDYDRPASREERSLAVLFLTTNVGRPAQWVLV